MSRAFPVAAAGAVAVFFVFLPLPLAAQSLKADYVEGIVQISTPSGWKDLNPGDALSASSKIRLEAGGLAELVQGATRISVSQPGTYVVGELLNASKKVSSWQLGNVVGGKLKVAVAGGKQSGTAVMGVRGAAAGEPEGIEWIEVAESEEAIAQGKSLLDSERYDEALKVFQDALEQANPEEGNTILYYIATVYSEQGKTALALRTIDRADIQPQETLYTDMVLLKGRLFLESLAFNDALELFNRQLKLNPDGSFAQALLILSSYCYRGLGKSEGARESLEKAMRLGSGSSELAQEAARLLKEL